MQKQKRFQVYGWVRPTLKPKESDGVEYHVGEFESLEEAEAVRRERWSAGWGRIEIQDLGTARTVEISVGIVSSGN